MITNYPIKSRWFVQGYSYNAFIIEDGLPRISSGGYDTFEEAKDEILRRLEDERKKLEQAIQTIKDMTMDDKNIRRVR